MKTTYFGPSADYKRSKELDTIPELGTFPSALVSAIIDAKRDTAAYRTEKGQDLLDAVCDRLEIPRINLVVRESAQLHHNRKDGATRSKTLGRYWHSGNCGLNIEIWNLTAKTKKRVAGKTFFNTLCHELCHHIDCAKLGIESSPHTSGFYKRISYIEKSFV